jgi:hypothetical protein
MLPLTCAEQGEDMQGYVTELILTLEAVVETLDSGQYIIFTYLAGYGSGSDCRQSNPPPPPHTHTHTHKKVSEICVIWIERCFDSFVFL